MTLSVTAAAAEKLDYVPATGTLSALWLLLVLPAADADTPAQEGATR